jgi:TonB family protein
MSIAHLVSDVTLRKRYALSFVLAVMFNVAVISGMAYLVMERPQPEQRKRFRQIVKQEQLRTPTETKRQQEQRQESMQQALPMSLPNLNSVEASAFTLPEAPFDQLQTTDWKAGFDLDGASIGLPGIELDKRAQLVLAPNLARYYPRVAKRKNIEGETLLELHIDKYGRISDYRIISSNPDDIFEEAIPKLIKQIRYEPAKSGNETMPDVQPLKLKWTLE